MTKSELAKLVAADIMQRDVVTVAPQDTLRDALSLMTESHVTGLPVMDGRSKCVGLICASDILSYEQEHAEESAEANSEVAKHFNPDLQQWESVRVSAFALEEFGDVRVDEVMSSDLVTVELETPVKEIARRMTEIGVHRVLVLDEENHLLGIISAVDFVHLWAES
ncbi:MAG: CBS domain-containing protein [Planctomycetales bacterium]|nr:CBS domain-containing protein [Planctomycetales bacterium]